MTVRHAVEPDWPHASTARQARIHPRVCSYTITTLYVVEDFNSLNLIDTVKVHSLMRLVQWTLFKFKNVIWHV